mmetsp:Transcript_47461/g.135782  ORF Transcript_47461/g.135782 Transcript_47461/m.135782 type:complete len:524 (+) Transcript_47461:207-1778(+)
MRHRKRIRGTTAAYSSSRSTNEISGRHFGLGRFYRDAFRHGASQNITKSFLQNCLTEFQRRLEPPRGAGSERTTSLGQAQDELPVAEGVVHACHGRPEFAALEDPLDREGRLLPSVGVRPLVVHDLALRVGSVLQRIVIHGPRAVLDLPDLLPDGDHGVAEAVQFGLVFRLGRFHHEGMRHGPRHRWRVEAVVLQPLRDVLLHNPALPLQVRAVNDELVRALAEGVGRHDVEVRLQPGLHVVRVQDGIHRRVRDTLRAQHGVEHPRDARDARLAPRRRRHGAEVAAGRRGHHGVVREVGRQVLADTDRAEAWAATAVGDAEGLVQVEVADVRPDHPWGGQPQLGVHVGAVHVDLPAAVVHDLADLLDAVLEERPGGRVGNHQRSQGVLVLLAEGLELGQVHALRVVDPLDLHIAHGGRRWVRAVSGARDDADVPVALALRLQVLADHEEASILAAGAAGGLEGGGVEARALVELLLKRLQHLAVALRLAVRGERVHVPNLGPAARREGRHGVKLHGAGAERDH